MSESQRLVTAEELEKFPDDRTVAIHRRLTAALPLDRADDLLELDDVVSGFRCTLREIFA